MHERQSPLKARRTTAAAFGFVPATHPVSLCAASVYHVHPANTVCFANTAPLASRDMTSPFLCGRRDHPAVDDCRGAVKVPARRARPPLDPCTSAERRMIGVSL